MLPDPLTGVAILLCHGVWYLPVQAANKPVRPGPNGFTKVRLALRRGPRSKVIRTRADDNCLADYPFRAVPTNLRKRREAPARINRGPGLPAGQPPALAAPLTRRHQSRPE